MSGADYSRTPNLGLYKPNYALDVGQWGNHLNSNSDTLDTALGVSILVPPDGSIQTALNSLPSSGGAIMLAPHTTYVMTAGVSSITNNVRLSAPGWGTVIQRGPSLAGTMLQLNGAGCLIEGITFDGNGAVNTTGNAEVQIGGAGSRITNVQVINSSATLNIAVSGDRSRVDHCEIIGRGVDLGTERGDGIWSDSTNQITIDHNHISGTGLAAMAVHGNATVIEANVMTNCRCYAGGPGGIIVIYSSNISTTIANNVINGSGSVTTGGIELYGDNISVTGNTVLNMPGAGLGVGNVGTSKGIVITGNTIMNVGLDNSGNQDGISVGTGVTDFVITGNRVGDSQTPPKMRWAVAITDVDTAVNRYVISGNLFGPTAHSSIITDGGVGVVKVLGDNAGLDTSLQAIYNAGTLSLPPSNPFYLLTTGTLAPVTAIGPANAATGAIRTALPNAAFVFTAGNNINNTITTTANVPFTMTMDGFGKWWLR